MNDEDLRRILIIGAGTMGQQIGFQCAAHGYAVALYDLVGLDTVWHITHYWAWRAFFMRQLKKNADFVKTYVDRGWLGLKSGRGFYTYPAPAFQQPDFIASAPQQPEARPET